MPRTAPISYRPSMGKKKLVEITKRLGYKNLNRFIDEAVEEKIELIRRKDELERLGFDVGKFLYEKNGWRIFEPGPKLSKELDEEIKRIKKGKAKYKKI